MRKVLLLTLLVTTLAAPASVAAHPLGNFTVNRFSALEPSGNRIYVRYVLDMAEVPAFQERQRIGDEGAYARRLSDRIARGLRLDVAGETVRLAPVTHTLAFPPGAAGLRTLRLELVLRTPSLEHGDAPVAVRYRDTNFASRIGWKEIVLASPRDDQIRSATVPRESISEDLLAYPSDLLRSPLDVTRAQALLVLSGAPGPLPSLRSRAELERRVAVRESGDGGFASLIAKDDLSAGFIALSLLLALFWGAAHAFSPGHGKAIVAGYLVGSRGTPRHAVLLGVIVTVTHTIGVFALGLVTLALSEFIVPDQLYPWLNLVSALLVVGVGLAILRWRIRAWRRPDEAAHEHDHGHHHGHGHDHSHGQDAMGRRGLLGIGISAGIIPCPTALVVLLAAISLQRVGYGLVLIVAFSVGLALAVTGIGLLAVTAQRRFSRMSFNGPVIRALPALSAFAVIGVGVVMAVRALPQIV
ncbi:MAG: sulfite exporter TauE/SafE family protein [Actinobacteria bacterium]|nr:sulfite exporter TauE/SafE family protein [Actinomycetota bacterium]